MRITTDKLAERVRNTINESLIEFEKQFQGKELEKRNKEKARLAKKQLKFEEKLEIKIKKINDKENAKEEKLKNIKIKKLNKQTNKTKSKSKKNKKDS